MSHLMNEYLNDTRNQLIKEIALVKDEPFNVRPDTKSVEYCTSLPSFIFSRTGNH